MPSDHILRGHSSYASSPSRLPNVGLVGDDQLSDGVAESLAGTGVVAVREGTDGWPEADVLVLPLTSADDVLQSTAEWAARRDRPVLVYAAAGGRLYLAVLRPPRTACPLCVSLRIRATRPDQALASLPLEVLLGVDADGYWPTRGAAAGVIAHHALHAVAASENTSAEVGHADLVELHFDTLDKTLHPLLPIPNCPACAVWTPAAPQWPASADTAPIPAEESWRRMQRGLDPLTGIFAGVHVTAPAESGPTSDFPTTTAWVTGGTDTAFFSPVRSAVEGSAVKTDTLTAQICAVGEGLERYSAGIFNPSGFVRGSLSSLGDAAVDPRSLPLHSAREYELGEGEIFPYRPDLEIDWVEGAELTTGRRRYVPAIAVHLPYRAPRRVEMLQNLVSTGWAAGSNLAHAIRAGLFEAIERDAVTIFWYNRLIAPTLDWRTLPPGPARTILEGMAGQDIEVIAKDITTDIGVPAILLLGRTTMSGRPVALTACRAGLDWSSCFLGVAQELAQVFTLYRVKPAIGEEPDETAILRDPWDFGRYYCYASRVGLLDFIREGPVVPVDLQENEQMNDAAVVDHVAKRLDAVDLTAIAVNATPIDVAQCGVTVARVVVPGLQPLSFSTTLRHLGGRRVYEAPVRMGLRSTPLAEDELNPHPVPMG